MTPREGDWIRSGSPPTPTRPNNPPDNRPPRRDRAPMTDHERRRIRSITIQVFGFVAFSFAVLLVAVLALVVLKLWEAVL